MIHNPHILAPAALILSILQLQLITPTLYAAVPMHWTVDVSRVQPEVRDVVRGETIALEATLKNDGKPFEIGPEPVCIFWQTNGMGRLWWSAPAQVLQSPAPTQNSNSTSNILSATFTPAMDPGAATVNGFLGSTGDIYRAAFQLRFRHGPGAVPNALPLPTPTIDFARVTVLNPPWSVFDTNAVIDIAQSVVAPAVNAAVNTGRAITASAAAAGTNYTDTVASLKADKTNTYTMAAADGTFVAKRDVEQALVSSIYPVSGSGVLSHLQANYTKSADIARDYLLKSDATAYAEKAALATATNALDAAKRGKTDLDVYGPAWDFSPFVAKMPTFPADGVYVYPCALEPREWFWAVLPNGATTLEAVIAFDSRAGGYGSLANALAHDITSFKADRLREGSQWEPIRNVTIHKTAIGPTGDRIAALSDIPAEVEVIDPASATSTGKAADALKTRQSLAAKADSADVTQLGSDVSQLNLQVSALGATANAEDARFVSTNYNSSTRMPEAYVEVKVSNSWITVWKEMTRWNWFLTGYANYTNDVASALANKGEREWGWFDSATGNPSPDGILQLSQPSILICSGAAYQRYATASGAAWVLESNGLVSDINGTTNGFFRISDEEGNAHFEIVKGDKQTLFATARTMTQQQMGVTHYFTTYAVTNAVAQPTAEFTRSLNPVAWIREGDPGFPCNVQWTNSGNNSYTVEWWPIGNEPQLFMRCGYERGGETYIRNNAPVSMDYIYLGGVKYRLGTATVSGHTVLTLTQE